MTNDAAQRQANNVIGTDGSEALNRSHSREPEDGSSRRYRKGSRGRSITILLIAVVVVAVLVITGIVPRLRARKALAAETN
ncbi:MAG: hypothetical protein JWQ42_1459, partial [Edaphobacter sp.]|nr:hypothetical protein [Edaphobacter sp.]